MYKVWDELSLYPFLSEKESILLNDLILNLGGGKLSKEKLRELERKAFE